MALIILSSHRRPRGRAGPGPGPGSWRPGGFRTPGSMARKHLGANWSKELTIKVDRRLIRYHSLRPTRYRNGFRIVRPRIVRPSCKSSVTRVAHPAAKA